MYLCRPCALLDLVHLLIFDELTCPAQHADREWDLTTAPSATNIPGDVPLTAHGMDQARELTHFFSREMPEGNTSRPLPDRIYSSAYWRSLQTIGMVPCGNDRIFVEPGLGERVLDDGLHPPIPLSSLQSSHFPAIDANGHRPFLLPQSTQESRKDLQVRMAAVADELIRRCDEVDGVDTVLWGTHASPAICLARALLGDPDAEVHTYVRLFASCSAAYS